MVMSQDQNAGRNHGIKFDNNSFKNVEDFKYFGTTLTNEILFRKKLRAVCNQRIHAIIRCRIFCLPVL